MRRTWLTSLGSVVPVPKECDAVTWRAFAQPQLERLREGQEKPLTEGKLVVDVK